MDIASEILSYRPRLKQHKNKSIEHITIENVDEKTSSQCFNSAFDNKPSVTIQSMKNDVLYCKDVLNSLELKVINKFGGSGFEDKLDDLIKENDCIGGDNVYEVYKIVRDDYKSLSSLYDTYISLLFGYDDPKAIENALIQQITELETGEYEDRECINYTLMAYDSLVSSVLINYSSSISRLTKEFYDTINKNIDDEITNHSDSMARIFKEKFERANKDNIARREQCNSDNLIKINNILCNIFEQRDIIEDVQATYVDIDKSNPSDYITILIQALNDEINLGFDMVNDLIKTTILTVVSREEYNKILCEKETLNIYYEKILGGV